VARECAKGLLAAHRITADGIFRTLALGVRASRTASVARETLARAITEIVADRERDGQLALGAATAPRRRRALRAAS
jgi:hypothetical protein